MKTKSEIQSQAAQSAVDIALEVCPKSRVFSGGEMQILATSEQFEALVSKLRAAPRGAMVSFSDLPLGARFRYPGGERVWTVIEKHRDKVGEPMSGVIAEWQPDMLAKGLWTGQSICSHTAGDSDCPDLVEGVD